MRTKISKTMVMVLGFIGFLSFLGITPKAEALEPRLLWEKTMPFKIDDIKMAGLSGDVILYSGDARQIILYDKSGNKRFHWGPRIDRAPMSIDISDDGSIILYETAWTQDYIEQKKIDIDKAGTDTRIHYSTKKGKELWNKVIYGTASLSPDGKMVANFPTAGEGKDLTIFDSQGKFLWKYIQSEIDRLIFSPDSNYILFYANPIFFGNDGLHLLDKSGNLLWKKDVAIDLGSRGWWGGISEGATYIVDQDYDGHKKVYDKQGNVIFEGEAYVSGDGKRLLVVSRDPANLNKVNKVSILSLPDKTTIREYSGGGFLSHDGRFLLGTSSSGNQLIIDTVNQVSKEIFISNVSISHVESTKDGKYLLFVVDEKKILYYQVY